MRRAFSSFFPLRCWLWSRKRAQERPRSVAPRLEQLEDRITPTGPGTPHLAFVQQTSNTAAGATMASVTVAIEDASGNIETSDNSDAISLILSPSSALHGTVTRTVSGGEATFTDLSINQAGTGFTLVASTNASGVSGATSNSFNITPAGADHLAFLQGPTNSVVGAVLAPALTAAIEDKFDNVETGDNSDTISLILSPAATLQGTTTHTVSGGEAVFNDLSINQATNGYTLSASTSAGVGPLSSGSFNVAPANVTTTAANLIVSYDPSAQTVTFSADLANASVPGNTVDEGTVTFTVLNGSTVIGTPAQGTVSGGKARAKYILPANLAAGTYTIAVNYGDSQGNFTDIGDTNATLNIARAPAVTTNPLSQTVNAGSNVSFTAAAAGFPAPTVQWQFSTDGGKTFTNVSAATSPTLTLTSVLASQNGYQFEAVFTNSSGTTTSSAAVLSVIYPPTVTTPPSNQTVTAGQTATFTVAFAGNPTPTVQWQVSIDGGKIFTNVSGATSATLTLTSVLASQNGYQYQAVVSNSLGFVTTSPVVLTVQTAPVITSGNSATFTADQNANFSVTASGSPTPTLTESGALPSGIAFADNGNGTATLAGLAAVGTQGTYHFSIAAHNGVGSDFVQDFTLTVNPASRPPAPPAPRVPPPPPPSHQAPALNVPPLLALLDSFLTRIETVNANGTETVTDSVFGITLIVSSYDSSGSFLSATLLGIAIPNGIWYL